MIDLLNKNLLLVTSEQLASVQIGECYFVTHPETGMMHEITTGRLPNEEEWDAYLQYKLVKEGV